MSVPPASWLLPTVVVRDSPIEGSGLFATEPIAAGVLVFELGGEVISDAQLAALIPPYSSVTLSEGEHLLLDPAHPVRYGNHGCDPNLWHDGATRVVARRNIAPGEELTIDYALHTGVESWSMVCRCGSKLCRETISGADWRRPALQRAYGDHWSPSILARISGEAG